jgi:hypothetical protein
VRWAAAVGAALLLLAGCDPGPRAVLPPTGTGFDYQLGGPSPPADGVGIVVRDRSAAPDPDRYSVCYLNAFQTQPGEDAFPGSLLLHDDGGGRVEDPDWPGEFLLDVSAPAKRQALLAIVGRWIDGCAERGFAAVDPDNLDSWTRSRGALTEDDAAATARLLVARAHADGLAIGQKNAAELTGRDLGFDFAVTEDCAAYDECDVYAAVYDVVLDVEYEGGCPDVPAGVAVVRRDLELTTPGSADYEFESCTR